MAARGLPIGFGLFKIWAMTMPPEAHDALKTALICLVF
jgi:hypothetical protein